MRFTKPAGPILLRLLPVAIAGFVVAGCGPKPTLSPLPHRAYVWQRDWNRAPVVEGMERCGAAISGFIVLGAELEWKDGAPRTLRPNVDWAALRRTGRPVGIALRVAPDSLGRDPDGKTVAAAAAELVAQARTRGLEPTELQLDYDAAQGKLEAYRVWVRATRRAIEPLPLVITTLPSWLDESTFAPLVREAGRYVLQVHSIRSTRDDRDQTICDPGLARQWVGRAGRLGVPFEIALPTYRYRAGYDVDGRFLGIESDSVRPAWPAGTRTREFETEPSAMASLVREWSRDRPALCQGLIWYRLPLATDRNNWPIETLVAVAAGRAPTTSFALRVNGAPPSAEPLALADLAIRNEGESDLAPASVLVVRWEGESRILGESLAGWTLSLGSHEARFAPPASAATRLPPGKERAIGWLRLEPAAPIHVETAP